MNKTSAESALAWLETQNFAPQRQQVEKIIRQLEHRMTQPMSESVKQNHIGAIDVLKDILPQLEATTQSTLPVIDYSHTKEESNSDITTGDVKPFDSSPLGDHSDNQKLSGNTKLTAFSALKAAIKEIQ